MNVKMYFPNGKDTIMVTKDMVEYYKKMGYTTEKKSDKPIYKVKTEINKE